MRQVDQDLLHASGEGDFERVKWAIEKGADVNANNGQMPLCLASWKGHESIIFYCWKRAPTLMPKMMKDRRHFIMLVTMETKLSFQTTISVALIFTFCRL
jgi:hypothetical protein